MPARGCSVDALRLYVVVEAPLNDEVPPPDPELPGEPGAGVGAPQYTDHQPDPPGAPELPGEPGVTVAVIVRKPFGTG